METVQTVFITSSAYLFQISGYVVLTELHYTFRVGRSTGSCIVKEVCKALWFFLAEANIPSLTTQKFLGIAAGFVKYANFPNVIGAIDGKHIQTKQPPNSGSMYFNYKGYFSTVLLAICDANYCFTCGSANGKSSDAGIFRNSILLINCAITRLEFHNRVLCQIQLKNFHVILGDKAFSLSENLLRPYSGKQLTEDKQTFNNRLSIARRFIECTFGILAEKWRIFHRPIDVDIDFANCIIKATCVLHNFVRTKDGMREESFHDTNIPHRHGMEPLQPNTRSRGNAKALSARYKLFFKKIMTLIFDLNIVVFVSSNKKHVSIHLPNFFYPLQRDLFRC